MFLRLIFIILICFLVPKFSHSQWAVSDGNNYSLNTNDTLPCIGPIHFSANNNCNSLSSFAVSIDKTSSIDTVYPLGSLAYSFTIASLPTAFVITFNFNSIYQGSNIPIIFHFENADSICTYNYNVSPFIYYPYPPVAVITNYPNSYYFLESYSSNDIAIDFDINEGNLSTGDVSININGINVVSDTTIILNDGSAFVGTNNYYATTQSTYCNADSIIIQSQINIVPQIEHSGIQTQYCINGASGVLSNPFGGTLSGTGVVANTFHPSLAGVGTHLLSWTMTSPTGVVLTDTMLVTVKPTPNSNFSMPEFTFYDTTMTLHPVVTGGGFISNAGTVVSYTFTPSGIGLYQLTYIKTSPVTYCTDTTTHTVQRLPRLSELGLQNKYCSNSGSYVLSSHITNITGSNFSGSTLNTNGLSPGFYWYVQDIYDTRNGYTLYDSMQIQIIAQPIVQFASTKDSVCINESGYAILMDTTSDYGTFTQTPYMVDNVFIPAYTTCNQKTYCVFTSNNGTCMVKDSIGIFVKCTTPITAPLDGFSYCPIDTSIVFNTFPTNTQAYINWIPFDTLYLNQMSAGTHQIDAIYNASNGCITKDTFYITIHPKTDILLSEEVIKGCYNETIQINSLSNNNPKWILPDSSIQTGSSINWVLTNNANILISETDNNNCKFEKQILLGLDFCGLEGFVDIVTPNQDGKNDVLFFPGIHNFSTRLTIYNRWGEALRRFVNYKNNWDGDNENGQELPEGVYYYKLEVAYTETVYSGPFTIIRN